MVLAVTEIMCKVIALVLEGDKGFIFGFPACAATAHERIGIGLVNGDIDDPRKMFFTFVGDFPLFEEIDQ